MRIESTGTKSFHKKIIRRVYEKQITISIDQSQTNLQDKGHPEVWHDEHNAEEQNQEETKQG